MTEPTIRDLFQKTLTGEPAQPVVADEDVVRGRARVRRLWRRRIAGGAAVLAVAGLGAAAVPAVLDDDRDNVASADGAGNPADYPPQIGADPVKQRMWDAIESALPAGVEVVPAEDLEHEVVPAPGPSIEVYLTRGTTGAAFPLVVTLEPTRTDLPEYRPCTDPGPLEGTPSQWLNCTEGRDDDGVYRAAGDLNDLHTTAVLAEDDHASVTVHWRVAPLEVSGDQPSPGSPPSALALDRGEGAAIADAVLAAAADLDAADLTSGVQLEAVADAWLEVRNVMEEALGGEITVVRSEDPVVDLQDAEHQAGTVMAEYVADDGVTVELWFWQRPRVSEPMCVQLISQCASVTGVMEAPGGAFMVGSISGPGTPVGMRGSTWVRVASRTPGDERLPALLDDAHQVLQEQLAPLVEAPLDAG
ncbi:hypothetical protein [Jiangella alba]|uniref:Uncharacterized protein n=1 Tax=Jiangella alba TaxID=561176 RepID=A0A1H5KK71_9ACTN|nr:hypothetical protein [Jiangella alba]SEE64817.1 hypothetical protein SAMN04488561_2098 [Jiangella alba]